MPRALAPRITQSASSGQPSINRRLRRWLGALLPRVCQEVERSAESCGAELYRKHFHSVAHACLLLFHALSGSRSPSQSYAAFHSCKALLTFSGLADSEDPEGERLGVSFSQFADSNTTRPAAFLAGIIPFLIEQIRRSGSCGQIPPSLHILDSTFLRVCLSLAPWLPSNNRLDVPGVRAHVQYAPGPDLPERTLITDQRTSDKKGFDELILDDPRRLEELRDHTLVVDLGYYAHRRFERLMEAGVHFVSPLHTNACFHAVESLPIQGCLPAMESARIHLVSDERGSLGRVKNGSHLSGVRLVTAWVSPLPRASRQEGSRTILYQVITDRFDLSAEEVIQAYLWRWQIELFFRWLKSQIGMVQLLGYSRNAMELTVYLAIVLHLLTVLAARSAGMVRRSSALLNRLGTIIISLSPRELSQPKPSAYQPALPFIAPTMIGST